MTDLRAQAQTQLLHLLESDDPFGALWPVFEAARAGTSDMRDEIARLTALYEAAEAGRLDALRIYDEAEADVGILHKLLHQQYKLERELRVEIEALKAEKDMESYWWNR